MVHNRKEEMEKDRICTIEDIYEIEVNKKKEANTQVARKILVRQG